MGKNKQYGDHNDDWKAYTANGKEFFFQTYAKGPALRVAPAEVTDLLVQPTPFGAASYYGNENKKGFITTYLLASSEEALRNRAREHGKTIDIRWVKDEARIGNPATDVLFSAATMNQMLSKKGKRQKKHHYQDEQLIVPLDKRVDKQFNILAEHVNHGPRKTKVYQQLTRHDVATHLAFVTPKRQDDILKHFTLVPEVQPDRRFQPIAALPNQLIKPGKGGFEDNCLLDIGINLSIGCVANTSPEGWYDPGTNCTYCYAYQNGLPFLTTLFDFDDKDFAALFMKRLSEMDAAGIKKNGWVSLVDRFYGNKQMNIRLGQNAEVNFPQIIRDIPGFVDTLPIILSYFAKEAKDNGRDFRLTMPSKMPEYDKERAGLMKEANTALLVSCVSDPHEQGITRWGFPLERRLEEALKHHEAGVHTYIYVATNIVDGFSGQNAYAKKAVAFADKWGLPKAYLDLRVTKKADASALIGKTWDQAKQPANPQHEGGGWTTSGQGYLIPMRTHPDYRNKKLNLCSVHVNDEQRCFGCGLHNLYKGHGASSQQSNSSVGKT